MIICGLWVSTWAAGRSLGPKLFIFLCSFLKALGLTVPTQRFTWQCAVFPYISIFHEPFWKQKLQFVYMEGQQKMCLTDQSACRACHSKGEAPCTRAVLLGGTLASPQAGKQIKIVSFLFLKSHFSLKNMPFKNNYMLPNSVVFSLIIMVPFFLMVSLYEKAATFFFILHLGSKAVKWLGPSLSRSHPCTRYQNHVCIPDLCLSSRSISRLRQPHLSLVSLFLQVHLPTSQLLFHIQVLVCVSCPGGAQE